MRTRMTISVWNVCSIVAADVPWRWELWWFLDLIRTICAYCHQADSSLTYFLCYRLFQNRPCCPYNSSQILHSCHQRSWRRQWSTALDSVYCSLLWPSRRPVALFRRRNPDRSSSGTQDRQLQCSKPWWTMRSQIEVRCDGCWRWGFMLSSEDKQ